MQFMKKALGIAARPLVVGALILLILAVSFSLFHAKANAATSLGAQAACKAACIPIDDWTNNAKELIDDGIGTMMAKLMVRMLVDETVNWINSGFKGSPGFIQDPGKFFMNAGDQIAGQFIYDIAPFLCEPFKLNLQLNLALNFSSRYKRNTPPCTLTDVINNVDGFVDSARPDSFVSNGGWDSWNKMTQNPQNNPYGSRLQAEANMDMSITNARGEQMQIANWGNGFKSLTDSFNRIITPGASVQSQIDQSLGADYQGIVTADEINEIVGALAGQLLKRAMTGLAGTGAENYVTVNYSTETGVTEGTLRGNTIPRENFSGEYTVSNGPIRIVVAGKETINMTVNQAYEDPGAVAFFRGADGIERRVDVDTKGVMDVKNQTQGKTTYIVTYTATYRDTLMDGKINEYSVSAERKVIIGDAKTILELKGLSTVNHLQYVPYYDAGVTAVSDTGADVSSQIKVSIFNSDGTYVKDTDGDDFKEKSLTAVNVIFNCKSPAIAGWGDISCAMGGLAGRKGTYKIHYIADSAAVANPDPSVSTSIVRTVKIVDTLPNESTQEQQPVRADNVSNQEYLIINVKGVNERGETYVKMGRAYNDAGVDANICKDANMTIGCVNVSHLIRADVEFEGSKIEDAVKIPISEINRHILTFQAGRRYRILYYHPNFQNNSNLPANALPQTKTREVVVYN